MTEAQRNDTERQPEPTVVVVPAEPDDRFDASAWGDLGERLGTRRAQRCHGDGDCDRPTGTLGGDMLQMTADLLGSEPGPEALSCDSARSVGGHRARAAVV